MGRPISVLLVLLVALPSIGATCNPNRTVTRTVHRVGTSAHEKQGMKIGQGEGLLLDFPDGVDPAEVLEIYLTKAYELGGDYVSGVQLQLHVGESLCFAELIPAQEEKLVRSHFVVREKTTTCYSYPDTSSHRRSYVGSWHKPLGRSSLGGASPSSSSVAPYSPLYTPPLSKSPPLTPKRCSSSTERQTFTRTERVRLKRLVPLPIERAERDGLLAKLAGSRLACAPIEGGPVGVHAVSGAIYPRRGTRIVPGPRHLRIIEQVCGERARWVAVEAPKEALVGAAARRELRLGTAAAYVEADDVLPAWTGQRVVVTLKSGEEVTGLLRRWQSMVLVLRLDDPEATSRYIDFETAASVVLAEQPEVEEAAAVNLPPCPGTVAGLDVDEVPSIGDRLTPEQQQLFDSWVGRRVELGRARGPHITGWLQSARRGRFVLDVGDGNLVSLDVGLISRARLAPDPASGGGR